MKKKWWHQMIGYQIYPRSFQDTNHDGIGDLPGVIMHLDDLKELGVNTLWLCPVYESPMLDSGYDISGYDAIDPVFGTMGDMEQLIREAGARGIRVIMDLVVNHTSSEHPWFQQALRDPEGEYGKYYIIREGKDGQPPNNWMSFFGGSAWERIGDTELYYLHLFTKWQPDLNWENKRLRREIYDMINRWLDRGIAGFRIDSINHLKKDFSGRNTGDDIYSCFTNVDGIGELLKELRDETYGPRGAFAIGEVNGIRPDQLEEYIGEDGYFSTMFDFTCMRYRIRSPEWSGRRTEMINACRTELFESQRLAQGKALLCNVMENHDTPRLAERFYLEKYVGFHTKSMLGCMNFFLAGIVFLYQGQAIGMTDYPKERLEEFCDYATFNLYEAYLDQGMSGQEALSRINAESREHSRTPMQWDGGTYGGFSDVEPWFAVNPNCREINFQAQKEDGQSLYSFYQEMIALRRREDLQDIFIYGETIPCCEGQDGIVAYERRLAGSQVLVACNTNPEAAEISWGREFEDVLLTNYRGEPVQVNDGKIHLNPVQVLILR